MNKNHVGMLCAFVFFLGVFMGKALYTEEPKLDYEIRKRLSSGDSCIAAVRWAMTQDGWEMEDDGG